MDLLRHPVGTLRCWYSRYFVWHSDMGVLMAFCAFQSFPVLGGRSSKILLFVAFSATSLRWLLVSGYITYWKWMVCTHFGDRRTCLEDWTMECQTFWTFRFDRSEVQALYPCLIWYGVNSLVATLAKPQFTWSTCKHCWSTCKHWCRVQCRVEQMKQAFMVYVRSTLQWL